MPVTVKGSGGGSVTLSSGAASVDTTLTLPNTNGTVALTAGPTFTGTTTAATLNVTTETISGDLTVSGNLVPSSSFKRNRLINGNFLINQRGYVSGTATASGGYMHDRWKSTTAGTAYTFTQGTPDTTINITSGTIAQVIEDKNVEGGVYVLSWTGTATARVAINGAATSGSFASSPIVTSSATAGQQITVEFYFGTVGKVQFESGTVATPYERQTYSEQLVQCQRYYYRLGPPASGGLYSPYGIGLNTSTTNCSVVQSFPVRMRTAPTLGSGGSTPIVWNGTYSSVSLDRATTDQILLAVNMTGATQGSANRFLGNPDGTSWWDFSAEL